MSGQKIIDGMNEALSALKPSGDAGEVVERLLDGVRFCGMHDDNDTELFDIEGANDAMAEAADHITTLERQLATAREALKEALHFITNIDNAHPSVRLIRSALTQTDGEGKPK